ncbi:unnamed protein product, partial [Amoebophrya sp. A120]|eukprot:GSA120T00004554001.1
MESRSDSDESSGLAGGSRSDAGSYAPAECYTAIRDEDYWHGLHSPAAIFSNPPACAGEEKDDRNRSVSRKRSRSRASRVRKQGNSRKDTRVASTKSHSRRRRRDPFPPFEGGTQRFMKAKTTSSEGREAPHFAPRNAMGGERAEHFDVRDAVPFSSTAATPTEERVRFETLPKLPKPSAEDVERPREEQRIFDLTNKYVKHWTPAQAMDEYVQNWYDQLENSVRLNGFDVDLLKMTERTSHGEKKKKKDKKIASSSTGNCPPEPDEDWRLEFTVSTPAAKKYRVGYISKESNILTMVNFSTTLPPKCFLLGYSGEEKERNGTEHGETRGKFGDGLPSSTLVLTREPDTHVQLFSLGRRYHFSMKQNKDGVPCFAMSIWRESEEDIRARRLHCFDAYQDTAARIQCGRNWKTRFDRDRYLFLRHKTDKKLLGESPVAEILKGKRHKKKIYVKGMFVQELSNLTYGINLKQYEMQSRDRQ